MTEAIIYARFSKQEQGRGHTIERQAANAREVCQRRGYSTSPDRTFLERGKSAFTGANRREGSILANIEVEIASGLHRGRAFVVEHLDRISRQGWEEVYAFLKTCSASGVDVATYDGDRLYRAGEPIPMGEIIEIIVKSELAAEEGSKKSRRVRASFASKREDAASAGTRKIATRPPAWIERRDGELVINEAKADVVRELHRLARSGLGTPTICKTLNERGVPTWKATSHGWHESYVERLLTQRSTIGEYHSPTHGDVILDYYPAILTVADFDATQAARASRKVNSRGRRGWSQSSLFGGLVRCEECAGKTYLRTTRRAGRTAYRGRGSHKGQMAGIATTTASYLVCHNAKNRLTDEAGNRLCTNQRTVRYEKIEKPIIDNLLRIAIDGGEISDSDTSRLRIEPAENTRQLAVKTEQAQNLATNLADTVSPILMARLATLEGEIAQLQQTDKRLRRDASAAAGATPTGVAMERVRAMKDRMNSDDEGVKREARAIVADGMKSVITSIFCATDGSARVIVASGLASFRVLADGTVVDHIDGSTDARYVASLKRGALAANAHRVDRVMKRAVEAAT